MVRLGFVGLIRPFPCRARLQSPVFALCSRSSPLKATEVLEIISQVRHVDLDGGSRDAGGAYDQSHAGLLASKHMPDAGADFASPGVGPGDQTGQRSSWLAPLVDTAFEHANG